MKYSRVHIEAIGYELTSVHRSADPAAALSDADCVFVGGGNTFRLLDTLYRHELLDPIRDRVRAGMPYMGASAGTNMACPTIRTTNDMPIVQPPSFAALVCSESISISADRSRSP